MSDSAWIVREAGRRILAAAVDGDGRVVVPYVQHGDHRASDLLAAAVTDAAIDAGQSIRWTEHPSGWVGELTPCDPVGTW